MIELLKHELGGMITSKFVKPGPKQYSFLIDDGSGDEKVKGTKKRVIKRGIKFENHQKCLRNSEIKLTKV